MALRRTFVVDPEKVIPIGFFVRGPEYKMWGLFPMDLHFFGPLNPNDPVYLLGTDKLGRDLLSRLIYGTRVSMSIGLIGVAMSLTIGVVLGSLSGFYGGWVDLSIQRLIEIISAMPTIPLWLGLAAAVPLTWSPLKVYFVITLIVSLLAWTGLAREVRGRFFALRGEDFVTAARLDGSTERRVIFRHILPSLTSHILAVVTLAIPTMIVAETALSFLGVGLKPPVVSYGVLLQDAQNMRTIATAPWLLIWPSLAVVMAVLSFNFMGDGLRDAADPYESLMGTKPNGRPTLVYPAAAGGGAGPLACATSRSTSTCAPTSCTRSATSASTSCPAIPSPSSARAARARASPPGRSCASSTARRASPAARSRSTSTARRPRSTSSSRTAARSARSAAAASA